MTNIHEAALAAFIAATTNRTEHDREWAEFMALLAKAARNPTPENLEAALDAEYVLIGDCDASGILAEAVGYDEGAKT